MNTIDHVNRWVESLLGIPQDGGGHLLWVAGSLLIATIWFFYRGVVNGAEALGVQTKRVRVKANKREDKRLANEIETRITQPLLAARNAREAFPPTEALAFYVVGNGSESLSKAYRDWVDGRYTALARAAGSDDQELSDVCGCWAAVIHAATPSRDQKGTQRELIEHFNAERAPKTQRIETEASGNDLRPERLTDIVGQDKVTKQIDLLIRAAKARGDVLDHVLLAGPPGLGKTTLALIIANEMGTKLHVTSGPAMRSVGDLHTFLKALQPGDILFIDEVHRMTPIVSEALYIAVEDYRADIDGSRVTLPKFTMIGATTHAGLIPGPLRDRFGYTGFLEPYDTEDLASIVTTNSRKLGISSQFTRGAAREIAARSRNTPRVANTLLKRVRDYSQAHNVPLITRDVAVQAIELYDIDSLGLDRLDRHVLSVLSRQTGPVGIKTLAAATGEAEESVEESEGFMIRLGFIDRTPRGRIITPSGRAHVLA